MKKLLFFLVLFFSISCFFFVPRVKGATCGDGHCTSYDYEEGCWEVDCVPGNDCTYCDPPKPANVCCRPGVACPENKPVWTYAHDPKCVVQSAEWDGPVCYYGEWQFQYCGAQDVCCSGGPAEDVCAGVCADSGCAVGGWYKTCCQLSGAATVGTRLSGVNGSCSGGGCSSGVPVRWANFGSPGPSCDPSLCLKSWDGYSWVVDTCSGAPAPTVPPDGGGAQPPPQSGGSGECGRSFYQGDCNCGAGPCEIISWGMWPNGNCSPCFDKKWDQGCGSGRPRTPTLISPLGGASVGASAAFSWYRYRNVQDGCYAFGDYSPADSCWGYNCYIWQYWPTTDNRVYELFITQVPNVSNPEAKNPSDWGAPYARYSGGDTLVYSQETSSDRVTKTVNLSTRQPGTYYWFIRARNGWNFSLSVDGVTDSAIGSFNLCAAIPPGQPRCVSPNNETVNDEAITLTWDPPPAWGAGCPDNKSYQALLDENGGAYPPATQVCNVVGGASDPATQCTVNLDFGKTYLWMPKATNRDLFTYSSNICQFTIREPYAWWQSRDGDIHANVNFSSTLIPNCSPTAKFLSMDGAGGSPGLVSWGGATPPNVDKGEISSTKWQANTAVPTTFNFDYLKNRLKVDESVVLPVAGGVASIPKPEPGKVGVYYLDNSSTVRLTGRSLAAGEKVIIYATGEVTVSTNDITLGEGAFFALISRGNINFSAEIGEAQGFFFSDQEINVNFGKKAFTGKGSFIGLAAVSLNRNLSNGTTGNCTASHTFVSMPELFFNAPDEFKYSTFLFRELAP